MRAWKFSPEMPKSSLPNSFSKSGTGTGTQVSESKTNGQLLPRSRLDKLALRLSWRPRPIQPYPRKQSESDEHVCARAKVVAGGVRFEARSLRRPGQWAGIEPILTRKCPRLVNQSPDSDSNPQNLAMNSFSRCAAKRVCERHALQGSNWLNA